jgi:Asp/Glu/hydantoin racemase
MTDILVLIHTVSPLIPVFDGLSAQILPGVQIKHILDEPLLERVRRRGGLASEDVARLAGHVSEAGQIDARAVLVTCSTISPLVDQVRGIVPIPVFKIDEVMIARAVAVGRRIGVIATNKTTLGPTCRLLRSQAEKSGKEIQVETLLVECALQALLSGDGAAHDRAVKAAVLEMSPGVDVVVLAQASMARVLAVIPEDERPGPVLSSPHLALESLREIFNERPDPID